MTGTPEVLSETPPAPADVLSELLGAMRLSGTVLFRAEFREPWSVATPEGCEISRALPFRVERVIPFHIIAAGACCIELAEGEPVTLGEGDAVLLPYGDGHRLCGAATADTVPVGQLLPPPPWRSIPVIEHGGDGATTSIICGFLQCDELMFHPILRHLPPLLHVRPEGTPADRWLAGTIRHAASEASRPAPGSGGMLPRLTELMFVEILRKYMQGLSEDEVGWFAAFNDPIAGAALKLLHAAPFEAWSVDSLAQQVGASRTVLADRFRHFLDQPPMQYLAHWRLQLAAQQLKSSDAPIKAIADRTGYESEAAFSRAFKRHFGLPPGDWRRRQVPSAQA
jgi:AraC-like DNA-binding protein